MKLLIIVQLLLLLTLGCATKNQYTVMMTGSAHQYHESYTTEEAEQIAEDYGVAITDFVGDDLVLELPGNGYGFGIEEKLPSGFVTTIEFESVTLPLINYNDHKSVYFRGIFGYEMALWFRPEIHFSNITLVSSIYGATGSVAVARAYGYGLRSIFIPYGEGSGIGAHVRQEFLQSTIGTYKNLSYGISLHIRYF